MGLQGCRVVVMSLVLLILGGCGEPQVLLSIAAGPAGGSWHPIGGALGNIVNRYVPGVRVNVETTEGGVQNVRLLGVREADIGLSIGATALEGFQGTGPYQQSFPNLRTLVASFQLGYLQMAVLENSELTSVDQIGGKRVALGPAGHGAIPRQREVYQEMGISFDDFTPVYLPLRDSAQALGDGRIDAAVLYMASPTPALMEFGVTNPFRLLPIPEGYAQRLVEKYPYFIPLTIPKDHYDLDGDVPTLATSNVVLVREDHPEELIYEITRALMEHLDDFRAIHPSMRDFEPRMAVLGEVVPFHPGAKKYYREVGLLD